MRKFIAIAIIFAVVLCSCGTPTYSPSDVNSKSTAPNTSSTDSASEVIADLSGIDFSFTDRELSGEYSEKNATAIQLSGSEAKVSGKGASFGNGEVTINTEGTYIVSGSAEDITLVVSATSKDKVQLVFDGVSINNSAKPAVYVKSADKVFITLKENTTSQLSDIGSYELIDGETTLDAVIFSKDDLVINGKGSLTVIGKNQHGIVSKDDLVITYCTLDITSKNVALDGKDCVMIHGADIKVDADSDGIRSDNTEDADRGYIYIERATLEIKAANDGIQAEKVLKLNNADINIVSGKSSSSSLSNSAESYKGLKSGSEIIITDGKYVINSQDDSIHSNKNITIYSGSFEISSGDDGIHADTDLSISGGEIIIAKSYEGIEASNIVISGGDISITASDDGMNAAGGNDGSSMSGRPGMGHFSSSTGSLEISGGYVLIDASGDGIDSNGNIDVSGGIILVSGPTSGMNGAFDHDGEATVTGGVLIATGSAGMASGFSSAENQGAMLVSFSSQQGGSAIAVLDKDSKVILSFTPKKAYQTAVITSPDIQVGQSYDIVLGAKVENTDENGFTQNSVLLGGSVSQTIQMSSSVYGYGGGFGGGFGGGGGRQPGGKQPGGNWGQRP